jgi:alginate O-acetyltransferase complex protein AlgI
MILYYAAPERFKNPVLFFASLIFYAWGEPVYVLLMLFSTGADYVHGILVDNFIKKGQRTKAKLAVASSVTINLLVLGFFKYAPFLIAAVNSLFSVNIPVPELSLPIGISFYTFQTMSYTIDVYRGDARVQNNRQPA